jgi:serine/threonine protein kinase
MSEKERKQLRAELSILKNLVHPNIVRYYEREHIKESQDLYIYMEYCGNGDLGGVIKNLKSKNQFAKEEFIWNIFSQIVRALYQCHYGRNAVALGQDTMGFNKPVQNRDESVILHRDLKPENSEPILPPSQSQLF